MKALGVALTVVGLVTAFSWTLREAGIVLAGLGIYIVVSYWKEAK